MKASELIRDIANDISYNGDREIVFSVDSMCLEPTHSICEVEHYSNKNKLVISVWNR